MRSPDEIRERLHLALVEEINNTNLVNMANEPENIIPVFIERVTNKVLEITLDEIEFRRRY